MADVSTGLNEVKEARSEARMVDHVRGFRSGFNRYGYSSELFEYAFNGRSSRLEAQY